jgi:predicted transcriptional regulator
MDPNSGNWDCENDHGAGDLADYEGGRSRIHGHRQAEQAILKIIAEAKERIRRVEEASKASQEKLLEDLPPYVKNLLRIIADHAAGIGQRDLQPRSHLRRREFHMALKELVCRGLIRRQQVPGRHRPKAIYFPVVIEPSRSAEVTNVCSSGICWP